MRVIDELLQKKGTDPTYKFTEDDIARLKEEWRVEAIERDKRWEEHEKWWQEYQADKLRWKQVGPQTYYRWNEEGKPELMDVIPMRAIISRVSSERILSMYQQNLSVEDIATTVERTPKYVRKALTRYGFSFGRGMASRLNPDDVPFGWKIDGRRLKEDESAQWILDKADSDLRAKVAIESVVKNLNNLKIKPPVGKSWIPEMLTRAIERNRRIKEGLAMKAPDPNEREKKPGHGVLELHYRLEDQKYDFEASAQRARERRQKREKARLEKKYIE